MHSSMFQKGTLLKLQVIVSNLSSQKFPPIAKVEASIAQGHALIDRYGAAPLEAELFARLSGILEPVHLDLARHLLRVCPYD